MAKGSAGPILVLRGPFRVFGPSGSEVHVSTTSKAKAAGKKKVAKKSVIASRKSCGAKGTGLSHYILMNEKAK